MYSFFKNSLVPGLVILCICAAGLFTIKYRVQLLNKELKKNSDEIVAAKKDIHILKAELTYLGKPEKLKKVMHNKLDMVVPSKDQIINEDKFKQLLLIKAHEQNIRDAQHKKHASSIPNATHEEGGVSAAAQ